MKNFTSILFLLFISAALSKGQHFSKVDSLKALLDSTKMDSNQVLLLNKLEKELQNKDPKEALNYSKKALLLAEQLGWKKGEAISYGNIGLSFKNMSDYPNALVHLSKSFKISEEIGFKQGMLYSLGNTGNIYTELADYPKALEYHLKTLKIGEEMGNKRNIAGSMINIGNIYEQLSDHNKALDYYLRGYKLSKEVGDETFTANALANLGDVYENLDNYPKALEYMFKALKIETEIDDQTGIAITLTDIGIIYMYMLDYQKALEYHFKSLELNETLSNKREIADVNENIGRAYEKLNDYPKALEYLLRSRELSHEIGALDKERDALESLAEVYERQNQPLKSLNAYKQFIALRDSVQNNDKSKQMMRQYMQFEFEKKLAADSVENAQAQKIKDAQISAQRSQIKQENTQRIALIGGLILVLLFALFMFNRFRITRSQKRVIEEQKVIVEEKNKEILDSISYARRLQEAILPPIALLRESLPDIFVFYKPKDIVAGDFYWFEKVHNKLFLAAADCTGHGVPGAMVSVVCSNALNRAVKEFGITDTGKILDKVAELIIETFEKSENEVHDGMDISLCCIEKNKNSITWSGANNPLLIVKRGENGQKELAEFSADKQPIGRHENPKPFTTHAVALQKGDAFYLFTDGFSDQFGGEKGKKFRYQQLKEMLLGFYAQPMNEQGNLLMQKFSEWKGELEQVDDICIIGVRI